jgi:competence protein ComEC
MDDEQPFFSLIRELIRELVHSCAEWLRRCVRREPLPERPLVVVAGVVAAGCGVGGVVDLSPVIWWLAAVGALVVWAMVARLGRHGWASLVLLVAIGSGTAGWSAIRTNLFSHDDLAWSLTSSPQPVAVEGVVVESPRRLSVPVLDPLRSEAVQAAIQRPSSECVVALQAVRRGASWRTASGRAALIVDGEPPDLPAGCRVRVLGRGMRPPLPLNPGEFDFRQRARSLRCLSIVRAHSAACVRVLSRPGGWSSTGWIDRLRSSGVEVLRRHLSPDRAPLAAALLLGSRESLPREDSLEFLVTGTIHILSISGLHVGFLSLALFTVLRMLALPRGWALVAVAGCTGLYMLLVRAETPVLRATLLVWLACLGASLGRRSLAVNSLALAAIIVLLWHPPELFRIGSQLSFLSTAVLIGASAALPRTASDDPIERLIERSRSTLERRLRRIGRQVLEMVVTGAAVWAVTAPVVASWFHLVSPVGLVLNPVIAPLVAMAMAWGGLCLAIAPVSTPLAAACGWACDGTLRCIGGIVSWAAGLPGGYYWVAGPPGWWVVGWYVVLVATLLVVSRQRLSRISTWVTVAVAWGGVGWTMVAAQGVIFPSPAEMRVVVAAMGHGCGIVVRSPTGRCLVYDAGRLGAPSAARRAMAAVLWHEGVTRIDTLVISHADTDHFNAVPELFDRFAVGEIVVPPPFLQSESWAAGEVLRLAGAAGIPVRTAEGGDSFALDPLCRIRVLHPPVASRAAPVREVSVGGLIKESATAPEPYETHDKLPHDNETSLVLAVEAAGRRLLLTGDLEGNALSRFIASDPDTCDVLVAPHHGSRTSLPPDIARATAADWVVVSGIGSLGWPEVREAYATARIDGGRTTVIKTGPDAESTGGAIALTFTASAVAGQQFVGGRWQRVPHDPSAGDSARTPSQSAGGAQAGFSTGVSSGRVRSQPAAISTSWLATKPANSKSTPLVNP